MLVTTSPEHTPQPAPPMPATHTQAPKRRPVGLMIAAGGAAVAIAAAVVVTLALTRTPDAKPVAAKAAPQSAASSPAPTPSAAPAPFALGQVFTFSNGGMTTTVLQYKQPVGDSPPPGKGEVHGGIEVQTCVAATADGPQQVASSPWSLSWADGTTATSQWSGIVSAEYPYDPRTVNAGRCVKGWIVFTVPEKGKPGTAVYEGRGNQGRPAEWKLD